MQIKIQNLKESQIEIEGSLPWSEFEKFEKKALKYLGENIELPGFRKGHVPENVLIKNIGDMKVLEEMAELALAETYPKILEEKKIDAIGRPEISITKLARGNDLDFKIKTTVLPELTLPDYKSIAKKVEKNTDLEVTEDEMKNTILQVRKLRAGKAETDEVKEEELPPLDEEFVKGLGGRFSSVDDFKVKLKENILLEKGNKEREKRRIKIIEDIIKDTKVEMPKILVDFEMNKMIDRLKYDVEGAGLKFDDYLKQINKSEEDIRNDWSEGATKKAKTELAVAKISEIEKITPEEKEIEHEVKHLMDVHKGADKDRARAYVENVLRNEKVFQFLENQ